MPRQYRNRRFAPAVLLTGVLAWGLTGCFVAPAPQPADTPTASTTESAPAPAPELVPDGSADENLPYFTQIVQSVWAGPDQASGRAYVDALAAGGFDKAAMQVTADYSTVGNPAESMQVSVRWGEECLIGQVGPATGEPVATVLPGLADGECLIGATRPIDW